MFKKLSLLQAAFLAFCHLPLQAKEEESWPKEIPSEQVETLEVRTEKGNILIRAVDNPRTKLSVEKAPDSGKCRIVTEIKRKTLWLEAKTPGKAYWESGNCKASMTVEAPARLSIRAVTRSGDIRVAGSQASVGVKTGSGNVRLEGIGGPLFTKVGSGSVEGEISSDKVFVLLGSGDVKLKGLVGSARIKTGNGAIEAEWARPPYKGKANITCGSGNVLLTFPEGTKLNTHIILGSGKLLNELGDRPDARYHLYLQVGSADVTIRKQPSQKL